MSIILGTVAAAILLYLFLRARAPKDVFKQFSLSSSQWSLLGSDLGKGYSPRQLSAYGVAGIPDAIFQGRRTGQIVVGEYKNRLHKDFVHRREYYQVMLYIGLAMSAYRTTNVIGVLSYRDRCIQVTFDQAVFDALVELRYEPSESLTKRRPVNDRPLHKRMKVVPTSRKIRFPG